MKLTNIFWTWIRLKGWKIQHQFASFVTIHNFLKEEKDTFPSSLLPRTAINAVNLHLIPRSPKYFILATLLYVCWGMANSGCNEPVNGSNICVKRGNIPQSNGIEIFPIQASRMIKDIRLAKGHFIVHIGDGTGAWEVRASSNRFAEVSKKS